jgi:hypothetical protein
MSRPSGVTAAISETSPIGDLDRTRLLPRLRLAVVQSLAGLAPPDRLLLSFYYLDDLTLAQIARLRGVHEATVSRQLERIRRDLREHVEGSLAAGRPALNGIGPLPALSAAEIRLCFQYATEDLPFDLHRALTINASPAGGEK